MTYTFGHAFLIRLNADKPMPMQQLDLLGGVVAQGPTCQQIGPQAFIFGAICAMMPPVFLTTSLPYCGRIPGVACPQHEAGCRLINPIAAAMAGCPTRQVTVMHRSTH